MSNEIGNVSDLTPPQRAALAAIVAGRLAWSSVAALVGGGHAPETLVELSMLDMIDLWPLAVGGVAWTLSPWGAWLLEVRLEIRPVRVEGRKRPRRLLGWVPAHTPPRQERVFRGGLEPLPWPDEVPDPRSVDGPEYLIDEVTEQPVTLFGGVPVLIDPRLARRVVRKRGRRRAG